MGSAGQASKPLRQRGWQIDNVSATAHRCDVLRSIRIRMARRRRLLGVGRTLGYGNKGKYRQQRDTQGEICRLGSYFLPAVSPSDSVHVFFLSFDVWNFFLSKKCDQFLLMRQNRGMKRVSLGS